jgi:hypothetical protein
VDEAAPIYFGGLQRDVQGGTGFRQFLGLLLTFAIFMVVWTLLHRSIGPETAKGLLISCAVSALLLPIWVRLGVMLVGARVRWSSEAH